MATLSLTNAFIAGTLAKASEVNQNFTDLINWSSGQIQNDNLGTMSGVVSWSVTTGVKAISIANSGNEGSISITQSTALNPSKASLRILDNAVQTSSDAVAYISMASASSTVPVLRLDYGGAQVVAVNKHRLELPKRTKTERDSISPVSGSILFVEDSPATKYRGVHVKTSEGWSNIMPSGVLVPFAGSTVPDGWLLCDGSEISQTTYATLYAAVGTTWNTGGEAVGNFRIPDMRRRTAVGSGGTALQGPANTLGSVGGSEDAQIHTHSVSGSTSSDGSHTHGVTDPGHNHSLATSNGATGSTTNVAGNGNPQTNSALVGGNTTGISIAAGGSHSHSLSGTTGSSGTGVSGNFPPSAVVNYIIKY